MNDSNSKISFHDLFSSIRPYRNLFLIPKDAERSFIINEVITWLSEHWGGGNQFFMPVFSDYENNQDFSKWINLVKKFDPDFIISLGQFPNDFLELVKSHTLSRSKPFQFNAHVGNPAMVHRGYCGCEIEKVLDHSTPSAIYTLNNYSSSGDDLLDMWFFSNYGKIDPPTSTSISVNSVQISSHAILSNCESIAKHSYPNRFQESPLLASMKFLGGRYKNGTQTEYFLQEIVIIGDSISDWALFQSLKFMYLSVYWIPLSKLESRNQILGHFDYHLIHIMTNTNRKHEPLITSASLDEISLNNEINQVRNLYLQSFTGVGNPKFQVERDFNKAVKNWIEWVESNNTKEYAITFYDQASVQSTPFPSPKNFRPKTDGAKFFVSVDILDYTFLSHPLAVSNPVLWRNEKAVLEEDSRRDFDGGFSFNPTQHLVFNHQDVDSILHGPKIKKTNLFEDLESILDSFGNIPKRSIRNLNYVATMKLWGADYSRFVSDFFKNDSFKLFSTFAKGRDFSRRNLGLKNSAGIEIRKKFFFSLPLENAFDPALTSINPDVTESWLKQEILVRGERLVCLKCGWQDFYAEKFVKGSFACNRCRAEWNRTIETMQGSEPKFLYTLNPLVFGMIEQSSELNSVAGFVLKNMTKSYFEMETEIEIYSEDGRCIQEIDIVANVDGKLVIGEAKINGKLNGQQLNAYADLCKKLRPEIFIVVTETALNASSKANIQDRILAACPDIETLFVTADSI